MRIRTRPSNARSGSTLVPVLLLLLVCGALAASVIVVNVADGRQVAIRLDQERAFQMAEAGAEWVLAGVREGNGELPDPLTGTVSPHGTGEFTYRVLTGDTNGMDDDGDGTVDNPEEAAFSTILSTGRANGLERTVEVTFRQRLDVPEIQSALAMNSEFPGVDANGNAFRVDGRDHHLDGTLNVFGTAVNGLTTAGDPDFVIEQIAPNQYDQFIGDVGEPSIGISEPFDSSELFQLAQATADVTLEPGTYSQIEIGTPTLEGIQTVYASGDLELSGGAEGAGLLAIDGDLTITGGLNWTGIVLVRGTVTFTGGGGTTHIVGAMIVGDEIGYITLSGTVDLYYSQEAVNLARLRLLYLGVSAWREVPNP